MADVKVPRISKDEVLNMIKCGVHDAWAEMLRGESGSVNADVVNAIQDAIAAATRAVVSSGQLRLVTPDSTASAAAEPGTPAVEAEAPKEEEPPRP